MVQASPCSCFKGFGASDVSCFGVITMLLAHFALIKECECLSRLIRKSFDWSTVGCP